MGRKKEVTQFYADPMYKRFLKFILKFGKDNQYSPSLEEMADEFDITTGDAYAIASELEEAGYLTHEKRKGRTWRVIGRI